MMINRVIAARISAGSGWSGWAAARVACSCAVFRCSLHTITVPHRHHRAQHLRSLAILLKMQKLFTYSAASLFAVSILIGNAAYSHQQFYPTVVSLTTSKVSRVMLFNAAFVLLVLLGRFTCWLFLGKLRPREVEVFPSITNAHCRRCDNAVTHVCILRKHWNRRFTMLLQLAWHSPFFGNT